jgi:NADPH:quinone reductase-like Zn-dependent oxidoreductase
LAVSLPYTLGRDVSGIIEQTGAQATKFQVGDEVFDVVGIGGGGYAEKVVLHQMAIALKSNSNFWRTSKVVLANLPLSTF